MTGKKERTELADQFSMFAGQLAEWAAGESEPVNPWHLDEWLAKYRRHLESNRDE